jgi:hypothetical protein
MPEIHQAPQTNQLNLRKVLTLWDLIFYGLVLIQPTTPILSSVLRSVRCLVEPQHARQSCGRDMVSHSASLSWPDYPRLSQWPQDDRF